MPPNDVIVKTKPEAEAILDFAQKNLTPQIVALSRGSKDSASILLAPQGMVIHSLKPLLDAYLPAPERRKGTARAGDLEAFVALVTRVKDTDSVIFADQGHDGRSPSLTAVIDYNRPGPTGEARFGEHRVVYQFPVSEEWKTWNEKDGEAMSQQAFAEFIENRIIDIGDPAQVGTVAAKLAEKIGATFATPTKLLELSRGFTIHANETVQNIVNIGTGETQVQFVEQHNDGAGVPLKVPGAFVIVIPIFRNGVPYEVAARLRYRKSGGSVSWFYELFRPEFFLDHAFKEACERVKTQTSLPLLTGSPES